MGSLAPIAGPQGFMELAGQGFPPLPSPIPLPGMNDSPLEFTTNKNQPPVVRETSEDSGDKRSEKSDVRRERENRDNRDNRDNRRFLACFRILSDRNIILALRLYVFSLR